ncbi:MAG: TetR/AcrR family transcriptional regulator C-terminal domain-containing protein [Eubacteriales bacterium]|nr:TetR/AcrR family transcriptional regulator C-terminal domain-containing protein [Eubacteriales bacterium]
MSQITKRALAASLKKMMEKKPLSKITVTDLAQECGINRHTFYYHFRDIYDLVQWIFVSETESVLEKTRAEKSWEQGMKFLFDYALDNKKFIMGTFRSTSKEHLTKFMIRQIFILIRNVVEMESQDIEISEEKKEFVAMFYTHGLGGIVMDWIEKDMRQEPDELIDMICALIQGEGKAMLRRFADN